MKLARMLKPTSWKGAPIPVNSLLSNFVFCHPRPNTQNPLPYILSQLPLQDVD